MVFQLISTTMRTLHNPRYAGNLPYGRRLYRRTDSKSLAYANVSPMTGSHVSRMPSRLHQLGRFQANLKLLEANGVSYGNSTRLTAP